MIRLSTRFENRLVVVKTPWWQGSSPQASLCWSVLMLRSPTFMSGCSPLLPSPLPTPSLSSALVNAPIVWIQPAHLPGVLSKTQRQIKVNLKLLSAGDTWCFLYQIFLFLLLTYSPVNEQRRKIFTDISYCVSDNLRCRKKKEKHFHYRKIHHRYLSTA